MIANTTTTCASITSEVDGVDGGRLESSKWQSASTNGQRGADMTVVGLAGALDAATILSGRRRGGEHAARGTSVGVISWGVPGGLGWRSRILQAG